MSHDRLTVLIECDTFYPDVNGAARFSERLAAGLVERGHRVHIAALSVNRHDVGSRKEIIEGQPMMVHRIPSRRWLPHEWLRFVLPWRIFGYTRKILAVVKPDVVHIQSHLLLGRGFIHYANKVNIPVVATNHLMPENALSAKPWLAPLNATLIPIARWDARQQLSRVRAVTTPTQRAADFLTAFSGINNVIPVSCGLDMNNYTADLSPRSQRRLLFVGRLTTEKHIDVLIRAISTLDPARDVQLDIVGEGDQHKNLEALARRLGISDQVHFHGHISDQQLRELYTAAGVFVMPSIAELQSIATMEAMASGLPIVAADAMALPHLVDDGHNGYLYEADNTNDLAHKIESVLDADADSYRSMQEASLAHVKTHDINRTLDTFEQLYRGEA